MNHQLQDLGYVLLPGFVAPARAAALARQLREHHAAGRSDSDDQVPGAPCTYNHLPLVRLLVEQIPAVGAACGEAVLPTYVYSRMYGAGHSLPPHVDRKACEISVSLHLEGDAAWDFGLKMFGQPPVALTLAPGDALLYLGCEAEHWRGAYTGQSYLQAFLHYVRAYGPRASAFFDREPR